MFPCGDSTLVNALLPKTNDNDLIISKRLIKPHHNEIGRTGNYEHD